MSQIKDPLYWKSVDAKAGAPEVQPFVEREFPVDASVLEDPLSRRTFLKIMGASIALAGASGCQGVLCIMPPLCLLVWMWRVCWWKATRDVQQKSREIHNTA